MRRALLTLARFALGAVFIWAAYTKLRQPWLLFAASIDAMQVLPEQGVLFVARVLPWTELVLGIMLLVGFKLRYFALFASGLLAFFFSVMLYSYVRGLQIDCACFGAGEALGPATLVRDGILMALSVWLTVEAFQASKHSLTAK